MINKKLAPKVKRFIMLKIFLANLVYLIELSHWRFEWTNNESKNKIRTSMYRSFYRYIALVGGTPPKLDH